MGYPTGSTGNSHNKLFDPHFIVFFTENKYSKKVYIPNIKKDSPNPDWEQKLKKISLSTICKSF